MRLVIFLSLLTVAACREKRSIGKLPSISGGLASIGSFFSPKPTPPPSKYPVWKVHKYSGVHLKPVTYEELAAAQPAEYHQHGYKEIEGLPPKVIHVPEGHYANGHLEPYAAADGDTRAALALIDSLGGPAAFLQEGRNFGRQSRSVEAEDRIAIEKPFKLKKKGVLSLLSLKGDHKVLKGAGGLFSGFGGVSEGISGGIQNFFNFGGSKVPEGPYPESISGPYPEATHVYRPPTTSHGFLGKFSLGGHDEGVPVKLPEPSLPHLPQLELVPEAPKLPLITLPGNYKVPFSTGSYVTIKVPKPLVPPAVAPALSYGVPSEEYGPPAIPVPEYGLPSVPAQSYGPPAEQYGPPAASGYSLPTENLKAPALDYGLPQTNFGVDSLYQLPQLQQTSPNTFTPSAPAPPVHNAYQGQVSSYRTPVHVPEYTSSVQGAYPGPPPVATSSYSHHPSAQGYSSFDVSHSPSETRETIILADALPITESDDKIVLEKELKGDASSTPVTESFESDEVK